jgi:fucose 4-O-acetylase-like acetyltransferase
MSPHYSSGSSIPIIVFNVVNQSFFMGSFFLLSGYFSAGAAKKRTRRAFLGEKLKRLGVPTVVYSVLSRGLVDAILAVRKGFGWQGVLRAFMGGVGSVRGVRGPVWYCALVVVFDGVYALVRRQDFAGGKRDVERVTMLRGDERTPEREVCTVSGRRVFGVLTLTATTCFLVRLVYPVGTVFKPMSLQLGYTPQYVFYYAAGIWVRRSLQGRLDTVVSHQTLLRVGASAALVTVVSLHQLLSQNGNEIKLGDSIELMTGGWNRYALLYAFWNELAGFTIGTCLLKMFAKLDVLKSNWSIVGIDVGKYSYAAFLLHVPVLIETQSGMNESAWKELNSVFMAIYVSVIGIGKSWMLGWMLKEGLEKTGFSGFV